MARLFDDGSNEYLSNANAIVSAPPFAISAWARSDDAVSVQAVFAISDVSDWGDRFAVVFDGNNIGDPIRFTADDAGGVSYAYTTTGYSVNTWHNIVALAIDTDDRAVLIDNGGKGTNTDTRTPPNLDRTTIGAWERPVISWPFSGRIAEVAIWDLSAWPGATNADKAAEFERVAVPALAAGYAPSFFLLGLKAYWPLFRDEDQDRVGGYDMTAHNIPGIAAHPPMLYSAPVMVSLPAVGLVRIPRYGFTNFQVPGIV